MKSFLLWLAYFGVGCLGLGFALFVSSQSLFKAYSSSQQQTPPPPQKSVPQTQTPQVQQPQTQKVETPQQLVNQVKQDVQKSTQAQQKRLAQISPESNLQEQEQKPEESEEKDSVALEASEYKEILDKISLEPFSYDVQEARRNPFRPPYIPPPTLKTQTSQGPVNVPVMEIKEVESTVLLPLQMFDVDELRLVMIQWGEKEPKAMIVDPNNKIHTVYVDDRMGRASGYVATIREGEVVVVEKEKARVLRLQNK